MKVFLSWSGDFSHKVALILRDWLPSVIQIIEPYVSSADIDKGARWGVDIAKELEASTFGILCVTPENMEAPWLIFEAGALSKTLEKSRVTPFLVGMRPAQLAAGPLTQFQATLAQEEDVWKLVKSLNDQVGESRLDETKLRRAFDKWWPELEEAIAAAVRDAEAPKEKPIRKDPSVTMEELLELMRAQLRMTTDLSARFAAGLAPAFNLESVSASGIAPKTPPELTFTTLSDGSFGVGGRGRASYRLEAKNIEAFLAEEGLLSPDVITILKSQEPGDTLTVDFSPAVERTAVRLTQRRQTQGAKGRTRQPPQPPPPPQPPQAPQPPKSPPPPSTSTGE